MSLLPSVPTKEYLDNQLYGIQNTFLRLIIRTFYDLMAFLFFSLPYIPPFQGAHRIIFLSDGLHEPLPTGPEVYQVGSSILSAPPQ